MRLITWIIGMAVALVTVLFAVSNRDAIAVTLWPFPLAIDLGLYAIVLFSVFAGFLVGALVAWVAAGKHRRRVRRQKSETRSLENELDDLRSRLGHQAEKALNKNSNSSVDKAA